MARRGLAAATREAYGRVARGYLVFLEQRGISDLADADGGSVLAFLESLLDRWAKSSLFWVVSNFRPFLKFTGRADLVAAVSLAGVRRSRPIIEVLGDADQELVIRACAAGRVSARNAAITLLAVTTGLRACDIIALRLADVDWRGSTIGIVQQKTGQPADAAAACAGDGQARRLRARRAARPRLMSTCSSARSHRTCGWPITLRCTR